MKTIEEIRKEDLISKNSLVVKAAFVSVILISNWIYCITVFTYLHHSHLPLETKNYATIYSLFMLVTIMLSFQLSISKKLPESIVSAQKRNNLLHQNLKIKKTIENCTAGLSFMIDEVKKMSQENYHSAREMSYTIEVDFCRSPHPIRYHSGYHQFSGKFK